MLFNSYYNGIGAKHPRAQRGLISRPSLQDVLAYRQAVDGRLQAVLATLPDHPALLTLLELGVQHEQQHQELMLTDIKHVLSCNPAQSAFAKRWPLTAVAPGPVQWLGFTGGLLHTGQVADDVSFFFDNETPQHRVWLEPFQLASRPVTYGDYLAFMHDGGYQRPELWLSMGWDWVHCTPAGPRCMPLYWERDGRAPACTKCLAMCGNGLPPITTPTRAIERGEVRWESTTASSCATSLCCAAARAPHHKAIFAPLTATSFHPMRSGNLVAFAWRETTGRIHSERIHMLLFL